MRDRNITYAPAPNLPLQAARQTPAVAPIPLADPPRTQSPAAPIFTPPPLPRTSLPLIQPAPRGETLPQLVCAGPLPLDPEIELFLGALSQLPRPRMEQAIHRALQGRDLKPQIQLASQMYRLNHRSLNYRDLPLPTPDQMRRRNLEEALAHSIQSNSFLGIDAETIKREEKCAYICRKLGLDSKRDAIYRQGQYIFASQIPLLRQSFIKHQAPFQYRTAYQCTLSEEGFNKWSTKLLNERKILDSVNRELAKQYRDTVDGEWGISIQPSPDDLDQFVIQIPENSPNLLKKKYSVFAFLKELGAIDASVVFNGQNQFPRLDSRHLSRMDTFFENQKAFREKAELLLQELDAELEIGNGGESLTNFYVTSLNKTEEQFRDDLKIEKRTVLEIRAERGEIVYPAAVQIQTRSDDLMRLLERYYVEFGFKDRKGTNQKTFIIETRGAGLLHKSNLPEAHFTILNQRLNRLLFIQKEVEKTIRGFNIAQAMREEVRGGLLPMLARMKEEKIKQLIDRSLLSRAEKESLKRLIQNWSTLPDYTALESAENRVWQQMLQQLCVVTEKSKTPLPSATVTPEVINRELYAGAPPPTIAEKAAILCRTMQQNRHFLRNNQECNGAVLAKLNAFQERTSLLNDSPLFRNGFEFFEQIVYRLERIPNLAPQQIDRFFATLLGVDWAGCNDGYTAKVQELLLNLTGEQGIDQLLMDQRNQLVAEYRDITYPNDYESASNLLRLKASLNETLGLGLEPATLQYYQRDRADRNAYAFVLSNYTPLSIYKSIHQYFKDKIGSAIEQNEYACFQQTMADLGVADISRYIDLTNGYHISAIQFDLPYLAMQYCLTNNYIRWGRNEEFNPQMEVSAYREQFRLQQREAMQQARRRREEIDAADRAWRQREEERLRHAPVYRAPVYEVYGRGGM